MTDILSIDLDNDRQLDKLAEAVAKRIPPHVCKFIPEHRQELTSIAKNSISTKKTASYVAVGVLVTAALAALGAGLVEWIKSKFKGG